MLGFCQIKIVSLGGAPDWPQQFPVIIVFGPERSAGAGLKWLVRDSARPHLRQLDAELGGNGVHRAGLGAAHQVAGVD